MSDAVRNASRNALQLLRPPSPGLDLDELSVEFFEWLKKIEDLEVDEELGPLGKKIEFLEAKVSMMKGMLETAKNLRELLLKQQKYYAGRRRSPPASPINLVADDESDAPPPSKVRRANVTIPGPSNSKATASRARQRGVELIELSDSEEETSPRHRTSVKKGKGKAMAATTSNQGPFPDAQMASESD